MSFPDNAIVTAAAAELAADHGVALLRGNGTTGASAPAASGQLADQVRAIVTALLAGQGGAPPGRRGVKAVAQRDVTLEKFGYPGPPPGMDVRTADVVTGADGAPMAAGYMTLTAGSFPWTLNYDEVQIVLEGELHIGTPDGVRVGRPGDVLYVPKGSTITFSTPTWAKFVYVTYPCLLYTSRCV